MAELCAEAIESLQLCGDSVHIADPVYKYLVTKTFEELSDVNSPQNILDTDLVNGQVDKSALKEAHFGLALLILESCKHDSDQQSISSILEDCKFPVNRTNLFCKLFEKYKRKIRSSLSNVNGSSLPHVVDVDWRLDYYIKNNHAEKVNSLDYTVKLKTESPGQDGLTDFQFSCSTEQLQDMVGKLREACKSVEKAGQS